MLNYSKSSVLLLVLLLGLWSCEDIIDIDLGPSEKVLVVDAWLDNSLNEQSLFLSFSQAYFDGTLPSAVTDASVKVIVNNSKTISFQHKGGGRYSWLPESGNAIGKVGDSFELRIESEGLSYTALSEMKRVPTIDSIGQEFRDDEVFLDDGIYAQFYARDFVGKGDTYWIKTFKNDKFLDKATELNIAYDAGFDAGTGIDGLIFIPPIRELVNENNSDGIPNPYNIGDKIRIELYSISEDAFNFLEIVRDQINNGTNGIFALPLANARTNIKSNGSNALGFFNVSARSVLEKTIK